MARDRRVGILDNPLLNALAATFGRTTRRRAAATAQLQQQNQIQQYVQQQQERERYQRDAALLRQNPRAAQQQGLFTLQVNQVTTGRLYTRYRIDHEFNHRYQTQEQLAFRDVDNYMEVITPTITRLVTDHIRTHGPQKVTMSITGLFYNNQSQEYAQLAAKTANYDTRRVLGPQDIPTLIVQLRSAVHNHIENYLTRRSDWVLHSILYCEIKVVNSNPLARRRGGSWIPTPTHMKGRVINVKNTNDHYCFLYAVATALWPDTRKNPERPGHYKDMIAQFNIEGLEFPLSLGQIDQFIRQNTQFFPEGWGINVVQTKVTCDTETPIPPQSFVPVEGETGLITFHLKAEQEEKQVDDVNEYELTPAYITRKCSKFIDLLLISDEVRHNHHYCSIKNYDSLFAGTSNRKTYVCRNCNARFYDEGQLQQHLEVDDCMNTHDNVYINLPKYGQMGFKRYTKKLMIPFVIYADSESYLMPLTGCDQEDESVKRTKKHVLSGIFMRFVSRYPNVLPSYSKIFNTAEEFINHLKEKIPEFLGVMRKTNIPMNPDPNRQHLMNAATHCHICEREFKVGDERVEDHDHLSGEFRGAAHTNCNLNYNFKNTKIPVYFHNLRGYDHHFVMEAIAKSGVCIERVLPDTLDRYRSITWNGYEFKDSMQMTGPVSLDTLVSNLADKYKKTKNKALLSNLINEFGEGNLDLLLRKGVFPYDFWSGPEKWNHPLPMAREDFHDSLNDADISDEDYEFHRTICRDLNLNVLKELHDMYMKSDVLLLADVFEDMRSTFLRTHKLDIAREVSAPSLSWDAAMRTKTKPVTCFVEGQEDMLFFCERARRGGNCFVSQRLAKANNKYLPDYDPSIPSSYIMYLDANNLYPHAMSMKLPTGGYAWVEPSVFTPEIILRLDGEGPHGWLLEVDGEFPPELHEFFNDYPMLPENRTCDYSPFMKAKFEAVGRKLPKSDSKLMATLFPVKNYILHHRMLRLAISLGFRLKRVNRVLQFEQDYIFRDYVAMNTRLRQETPYKSEQDGFKLLNNSLYGKTCENVRNYRKIEVLSGEAINTRGVKLVNDPLFQEMKDFGDIYDNEKNFVDYVAVEMKKKRIKYDKPVILGTVVLELSKLVMYEFHYNVMKPLYRNKELKLLYTDTDSLMYWMATDDVYEDMKAIKDYLDLAEYPVVKDLADDLSLYQLQDSRNKKVLGKFKDECATGGKYKMITEFVGLRPKMYSFQQVNIENNEVGFKNACKGVKKTVDLRHQNYLDCVLGNDSVQDVSFNAIRAFDHEVYTVSITKTGLSVFDDKRYVLPDGISTRAHGHCLNDNMI